MEYTRKLEKRDFSVGDGLKLLLALEGFVDRVDWSGVRQRLATLGYPDDTRGASEAPYYDLGGEA